MKAPYKIIFNSDITNVIYCVSPYNEARGASLTAEKLDASVKEAADAGADAFSFTPGLCWVPWWPSEEFPAKEHVNWYLNEFQGTNFKDSHYNYAFNDPNKTFGDVYHDIVQEQIDSCRKYNMAAILSYRMNDSHFSQRTNKVTSSIAYTPIIQIEHPEWLQSEGTMFERTLFDYRFPEYRAFRLRMIKELIRNYEIDGFEMDFMRWHKIFTACRTTSAERLQIMTDFIKEIRTALDQETAKDGRPRHLIAKIPAWTTSHDSMGIDLKAWTDAGVTIFNLSASYYTVQDPDIAEIKAQIPDTPVYYELYHTVCVAPTDANPYFVNQGIGVMRRTTVEQLYTTALLAYEMGADGISLFNFQYYRGIPESPNDDRDNINLANEPPFYAVKNLGDRNYLSKQHQHYFYGRTDKRTFNPCWHMPQIMCPGANLAFEMFMVEPDGGWSKNGVLRLQSEIPLTDADFTVSINGKTLALIESDRGDPYNSPHKTLFGTPEQRKCYLVPKTVLHSHKNNKIEISQVGGGRTFLSYLDLSI